MAAILRFETVGARVGRAAERLADLDFGLHAGEIAFVAGGRGSGKTMLADLAALRRRPDRGRIRLLGRDSGEATPGEIARLRRRIGHAAERQPLLARLTPAENVAVPLRLAGVTVATALADAAELLRWLGCADPMARAGEGAASPDARRIAIARALVHRPALAILDEPFGALDPRTADRLRTLIDRLSRDGTAFLVTGSEEADAPAGATRFRLASGRLEAVDAPGDTSTSGAGR